MTIRGIFLSFALNRRWRSGDALAFSFFMLGVLSAMITKFRSFDFPLHQFLIFARIIINPRANGAFEFY